MASKLSILAQAGANLAFVFTQRRQNQPGSGILYVTQLSGPDQLKAAKSAGLHKVHDPVVLRVEGDNEAGLAHRLTQQWAIAGIRFQGLTMAVVNGKFIGYAMFDTVTDSNKAATILADLGTH